MTPYNATASEVVARFGDTDLRRGILDGWLSHRESLHKLGFTSGVQWIDGSFVEDKVPACDPTKPKGDIDCVTLFARPPALLSQADLQACMLANPETFSAKLSKLKYCVDSYYIDLNGDPNGVLLAFLYWSQLFSHQRATRLWKGIVCVSLDPADDANARALLVPAVGGSHGP